MVRGWIKTQDTDNELFTIRVQVADLLRRDANVLEVGSGAGDLLFMASEKIRYGLGLEESATLVRIARKRFSARGIRNVANRRGRFPRSIRSVAPVDYGVAINFFSALEREVAISTLVALSEICSEILIADFVEDPGKSGSPQPFQGKDAKNRKVHFRSYVSDGFLDGLIERAELEVLEKMDTRNECLKIYRLAGKGSLRELGQGRGGLLHYS